MDRYLIIHRDKRGHYCVWSSYPDKDEIAAALYHSLADASCGEEYTVIDTLCAGNGVIGVYTVEKRVIFRSTGALETAWSKNEDPKAYRHNIGDGAELIRFV
jgi:hypothetical protein